MNIKSKKLLVVFAVVLITTVIAPIRSNAGLQANKGGKSLTNTNASQFFDGMRKMEIQYGTLGKNAVLNDKYLDTTNNGIDVHMALNTEWGTVALLMDSGFGIGKSVFTILDKSSTGNESGIYGLANETTEYVAGLNKQIPVSNQTQNIWNADSRYYNMYASDKEIKIGDAFECNEWGASCSGGSGMYGRNYYSSGYSYVFGRYKCQGNGYYDFTSRAVVVCGENL